MTSENEPLNIPNIQPSQSPKDNSAPQSMQGASARTGTHNQPHQGRPSQRPSGPAPVPPRGPRPGGSSEQSSGKRRGIIIAVGIVVIVVVVALLVWMFACSGSILDQNAREGQAPYKTAEEIQAELDRQVEEGMFNISISSVIEFTDGTSDGIAYIENVPGNRYNMQVTITDDDTGEVLYESGVLKPNQYIETIKLAKDLDAGTYPATATFTALDTETNEEIGKAAAKVTLKIQE